jgi:hypothetical protein
MRDVSRCWLKAIRVPSREPAWFSGHLGLEHLHRDMAMQLPINGEVDLPHAARAKQVNDRNRRAASLPATT